PLLRAMYLATLVWPTSMPSLRSSPWILGAPHNGLAMLISADQSANFQRHRWSTAAASRFPAPIQPETGAVPADHGIGSDNCKCIIHLGKQPADAAQYQPVNRPKSKSPGVGTPQHIDLLPQHQNLCLEHCARDRSRSIIVPKISLHK